MPDLSNLSGAFLRFLLAFVPAVIGIVCHEVAHGYVAYRFGDPTAKVAGRLTLNPVKHIDPTGLMVFVLTALFTPFVIGWAKPVPVNARYFKRPKEGMMLVAFAGPLTNFIVAAVCAIIAVLINPFIATNSVAYFIQESAVTGVIINCSLAWFNLIPIPPLDGGHILFGLLPESLAQQYAKIAKYGFFIIIACLYFNLFSRFLGPLILGSARTILDLVNIF